MSVGSTIDLVEDLEEDGAQALPARAWADSAPTFSKQRPMLSDGPGIPRRQTLKEETESNLARLKELEAQLEKAQERKRKLRAESRKREEHWEVEKNRLAMKMRSKDKVVEFEHRMVRSKWEAEKTILLKTNERLKDRLKQQALVERNLLKEVSSLAQERDSLRSDLTGPGTGGGGGQIGVPGGLRGAGAGGYSSSSGRRHAGLGSGRIQQQVSKATGDAGFEHFWTHVGADKEEQLGGRFVDAGETSQEKLQHHSPVSELEPEQQHYPVSGGMVVAAVERGCDSLRDALRMEVAKRKAAEKTLNSYLRMVRQAEKDGRIPHLFLSNFEEELDDPSPPSLRVPGGLPRSGSGGTTGSASPFEWRLCEAPGGGKAAVTALVTPRSVVGSERRQPNTGLPGHLGGPQRVGYARHMMAYAKSTGLL